MPQLASHLASPVPQHAYTARCYISSMSTDTAAVPHMHAIADQPATAHPTVSLLSGLLSMWLTPNEPYQSVLKTYLHVTACLPHHPDWWALHSIAAQCPHHEGLCCCCAGSDWLSCCCCHWPAHGALGTSDPACAL
jgi:hypothetical protein